MAIPVIGWLLLALGAGAVYLFGKGANPPPPGTVVIVGTVGDLSFEVRQQTSVGLEWYVRDASETLLGSGAGTPEQNPVGAMLELAFASAPDDAPITLTFLASGMTDPRAKEHGDITLSVDLRDDAWHWSAADDAHDIFALGADEPSRGAAFRKAETTVAAHLGVTLEGLGQDGYPAPPQPPPDAVHGVVFQDCTVRTANPAAWLEWARAQVVATFDAASGIPTPDALLDATVGAAMAHAGHPGCELEDLRFGTATWAEVEPKIQGVLDAIDDGTLLAIRGPDELIAAALGGLPPDNRGAKEMFGSWSIVARPQDGAPPAKAFAWWAWDGARLLDSDADLHGWAASEGEALALAKAAIQAQPADVGAEVKE